MSNELHERMAVLETKVEQHDNAIRSQNERNDTLTRLTVVMEQQQIRDEQQTEQLSRFANTLEGVNSSLSEINRTQHQMQRDLSDIGGRVEIVEQEQKKTRKALTLDLTGIPKRFIKWAVTVIAGGIALYLYIRFGLK